MKDTLLEELFAHEQTWDKAILDGKAKGIKPRVLEKYSSPSYREAVMDRIAKRRYRIRPPHEAKIPKDDGTMRTVYANEAEDRILLTAVNDTLFRLCPDMVHPSCKSYKSGIGCGRIARQVSADLAGLDMEAGCPVGRKVDLTKYFDSVPIGNIEAIFDGVAQRLGPSSVLDMLWGYYHDDVLLDLEKKPVRKYTSLKQGCAVAAFLADAALYHVDQAACAMGVPYYRYSDDILMLGPESEKAFGLVSGMLSDMGLALNPKKVEILEPDAWFTFLGFSLHRSRGISLSRKRVKNFQAAIEKRTIGYAGPRDSGSAMRRVARYLYDRALTEYGYAEGILPIMTSKEDLRKMDLFILDCLRACDTGRDKLGGLGWDRHGRDGVITRGRGRNVASNREKRPDIDGYVPLSHMQKAFFAGRPVYEAYARTMTCR